MLQFSFPESFLQKDELWTGELVRDHHLQVKDLSVNTSLACKCINRLRET